MAIIISLLVACNFSVEMNEEDLPQSNNQISTTSSSTSGNSSSPAPVVLGPNTDPTLTGDGDFVVVLTHDTAVTTYDLDESVTGNDTDPDGEALTYSCSFDRITDGTVTAGSICNNANFPGLSLDSATGILSFTDISEYQMGFYDFEYCYRYSRG